MGWFKSLSLLIKYDYLGAEFFESVCQIFSQAHKKILIALIALALNEHRTSVKILTKVLPHVPNDRLVKNITTDGGLSTERRELFSRAQ